LIVKSSR